MIMYLQNEDFFLVCLLAMSSVMVSEVNSFFFNPIEQSTFYWGNIFKIVKNCFFLGPQNNITLIVDKKC